MPNWSNNKIALQGTKEAVHKFIKIGLENSSIESVNDIEKDFKLLVSEGKTKYSNGSIKTDATEVIYEKRLTGRTFLPMPDTFLLYDTTNYPNKYPIEVVKEQQEKYGAIGWYDYNLKTLGTKWNFQLNEYEDITLSEPKDGYYRIIFTCETAWSVPSAWLVNVQELVPELQVFIVATEESNAYLFTGYVSDGNLCDYEDFTNEHNEMWKEFNEKRDKRAEEIKADQKIMDELRAIAIGNYKADNNGEEPNEEEINNRIGWGIDEILDKEIGYYVEDGIVFDKLYESFDKMLEEYL